MRRRQRHVSRPAVGDDLRALERCHVDDVALAAQKEHLIFAGPDDGAWAPLVDVQLVGSAPRATAPSRVNARHRIERGSQHSAVMAVGSCEGHVERRAVGVRYEMALAARLTRPVGFGTEAATLYGWYAPHRPALLGMQ